MEKNKHHYVYIITNTILNKQYVGSRISKKLPQDDKKYMGSSKSLHEDYNIYGIHNFTKKILKDNYQNAKDMLSDESKYMHKYNTFAPNGYNRFDPIVRMGFHTGGIAASEKSKEKNRNSHIGKKASEYTKQLMSEVRTGGHHAGHSEESKRLIGFKSKGRHHSEETKLAISNAMGGENHPLFGTKRNDPKTECIHCHRLFNPGNYVQHKDKCKLKYIN